MSLIHPNNRKLAHSVTADYNKYKINDYPKLDDNYYNELKSNENTKFQEWNDKNPKKHMIVLGFVIFFLLVGMITTLFTISSKINPDSEEESEDNVYYIKIGSYVSYLSKTAFWIIIGSLSLIATVLIIYLLIRLLRN
jgi:hypothetical protein